MGENLYLASSWKSSITWSNMACVSAEAMWYSEIDDYKFTARPWTDNAQTFSRVGHFTQVVWKNSARLGCGAAVGKNGACIVVSCRYSPAGNYIGDLSFLNNVKPPLK